jgi:hypothetical protein
MTKNVILCQLGAVLPFSTREISVVDNRAMRSSSLKEAVADLMVNRYPVGDSLPIAANSEMREMRDRRKNPRKCFSLKAPLRASSGFVPEVVSSAPHLSLSVRNGSGLTLVADRGQGYLMRNSRSTGICIELARIFVSAAMPMTARNSAYCSSERPFARAATVCEWIQ